MSKEVKDTCLSDYNPGKPEMVAFYVESQTLGGRERELWVGGWPMEQTPGQFLRPVLKTPRERGEQT